MGKADRGELLKKFARRQHEEALKAKELRSGSPTKSVPNIMSKRRVRNPKTGELEWVRCKKQLAKRKARPKRGVPQKLWNTWQITDERVPEDYKEGGLTKTISYSLYYIQKYGIGARRLPPEITVTGKRFDAPGVLSIAKLIAMKLTEKEYKRDFFPGDIIVWEQKWRDWVEENKTW